MILTIVEVGGNFRKPVEGVCTATPVQYSQQRWHSIWVLEEYGIHQTEIGKFKSYFPISWLRQASLPFPLSFCTSSESTLLFVG